MKRVKELLEEVAEGLKGHSATKISYESGVSLATVNNIRSGKQTNPTVEVIDALQVWIEKNSEVENNE